MSEPSERMVNRERPPDQEELSSWLGSRNFNRWTRIRELIDQRYPDVFTPDWHFGGKKYGWALRYKKSKSFCTLIPERKRVVVQLVFGAKERAQVEEILPELSPTVREAYSAATTYHDGKWVGLEIDGADKLADLTRLMEIKRRPQR